MERNKMAINILMVLFYCCRLVFLLPGWAENNPETAATFFHLCIIKNSYFTVLLPLVVKDDILLQKSNTHFINYNF
jgi:hypothetical protein